MKVQTSPARMLLAFVRDGSPGTGEAEFCGLCRRYKSEFIISLGLRQLFPKLPEKKVVCTNADGPCLAALGAKPILDALKGATRP